jgi:iron(II)-dependent oxidoreductase
VNPPNASPGGEPGADAAHQLDGLKKQPMLRAMGNRACATGLVLLVFALPLRADPAPVELHGSQLFGPGQEAGKEDWFSQMTSWRKEGSASFDDWIAGMRAWRTAQLASIHYDDSQYRRPELLWTQRDFVQPQVMVEDRFLYDAKSGKYTVDRLLGDLDRRYGGVDGILLWPVYPNIGIDNRNQWDLARDIPGGVTGLRAMIQDFHHRGVRVFFPTMPWDTGTREAGMPHSQATAALMAEIGADGENGDTFAGVPLEYRTASDLTGHPVALEPELSPKDDAMLAFNQQSWGYWDYPFAPMVSKWKWLEPRHMINVCDRWATNHTDNLQAAFFNGVGFESWENIWGFWNQISPRDAEALRRIAAIYRALPQQLVSQDWTPHVPTLRYGVYASRFPSGGVSLWTVVNRNEFDVGEEILAVPYASGMRFFDVWNGTEMKPRIEDGRAFLSFTMEPRGFGAVVGVEPGSRVEALAALLAEASARSAKPLESFSNAWHFLPQKLAEVAPTARIEKAPDGMVRIPRGEFIFKVNGIEIEGGNRIGLDVQYPWEDSPRRQHYHRMEIRAFFIDRYPVTNGEFKAFVDATHYQPADGHNFLLRWVSGAPRTGEEKNPVTWVSLEDARAYARWAGKRLPREWEWQYAAQGADQRVYPWGNSWDETAVPKPSDGHELPAPDSVGAHPRGASPFGVEDMVGNVWQWTDEYMDDHTRAAILRGGSFYQPQHSIWYFPQAYKLTEHGKYLLMAPSKDRAGTLGFRCAADAE